MANTIRDISGAGSGPPIDPADQTSQSRQAGTPRPSSAKPTSPTSVAADDTNLSALGEILNAATREAAARSGFRPELVARLKAEISSATYAIDPQRLAEIVAGVLGRANP